MSSCGRKGTGLQKRLKKAELIIEIQKKISQILGIPLKNPELARTTDGSRGTPLTPSGTREACFALGIPRASLYRHRAKGIGLRSSPGNGLPLPGPCLLGSGRKFWMFFIRNGLSIRLPGRFLARFWMKAGTFAPSEPCIVSWRSIQEVRERRKPVAGILRTRNRSCWRRVPIRFGLGILPSSWAGQMELFLSFT